MSEDIPDDLHPDDFGYCAACGGQALDIHPDYNVWLHPECEGEYKALRNPHHFLDGVWEDF